MLTAVWCDDKGVDGCFPTQYNKQFQPMRPYVLLFTAACLFVGASDLLPPWEPVGLLKDAITTLFLCLVFVFHELPRDGTSSIVEARARRSSDDDAVVRQLVQSHLKCAESVQTLAASHHDTKELLHQAVVAHNAFSSKVTTEFTAVKGKVDTVQRQVVTVEEKVDTVQEKVDSVAHSVEVMQQDREKVRHDKMKKSTKDKQFLAPMAALFNTATGVTAWIPVLYKNHGTGATYDVTVFCMPFLVWYRTKERPDALITEVAVRAYIGGDDMIPIHPEIPYDDFCAIVEQTPFRPRQVFKNGGWRNEAWNRSNFLMVPSGAWKQLEQRNEKDFPNRPRTLPLRPKLKRSFAHLGNNIAYTQAASDDDSSGYNVAFNKTFTMDEKALVPAMEQTFTTEVLDTRAMRDFFGITEEQRGKCHIVGGVLQEATIKTHAQAYKDSWDKIEASMNRRLKRAASRMSANKRSKKRKV